MTALTPKMRECLDAIRALTKRGVAPSYDELRIYLGYSSKSDIHRLVHSLADRGKILLSPAMARTIIVVEDHPSVALMKAWMDAPCEARMIFLNEIGLKEVRSAEQSIVAV